MLTINHSKPYNLSLKTETCQLLVTNLPGGEVRFPDKTPVKRHQSIKYLGTLFSVTLDVGLIIRQKITEASQTLGLLWPTMLGPTNRNGLETHRFQRSHKI